LRIDRSVIPNNVSLYLFCHEPMQITPCPSWT
jgi:hypothetical protein